MVDEPMAGAFEAARGRRLGPGMMAAIRGGRFGRCVGLIALLIGFMPGLSEVESLVGDREAKRDEAEAAVGALWGPAQRVVGPFLLVPEDRVLGSGADLNVESVHHVATPRELGIDVTLVTETRRRGLFDVPVYTAEVTVAGRFDDADLAAPRRRAGPPGRRPRPIPSMHSLGRRSAWRLSSPSIRTG